MFIFVRIGYSSQEQSIPLDGILDSVYGIVGLKIEAASSSPIDVCANVRSAFARMNTLYDRILIGCGSVPGESGSNIYLRRRFINLLTMRGSRYQECCTELETDIFLMLTRTFPSICYTVTIERNPLRYAMLKVDLEYSGSSGTERETIMELLGAEHDGISSVFLNIEGLTHQCNFSCRTGKSTMKLLVIFRIADTREVLRNPDISPKILSAVNTTSSPMTLNHIGLAPDLYPQVELDFVSNICLAESEMMVRIIMLKKCVKFPPHLKSVLPLAIARKVGLTRRMIDHFISDNHLENTIYPEPIVTLDVESEKDTFVVYTIIYVKQDHPRPWPMADLQKDTCMVGKSSLTRCAVYKRPVSQLELSIAVDIKSDSGEVLTKDLFLHHWSKLIGRKYTTSTENIQWIDSRILSRNHTKLFIVWRLDLATFLQINPTMFNNSFTYFNAEQLQQISSSVYVNGQYSESNFGQFNFSIIYYRLALNTVVCRAD